MLSKMFVADYLYWIGDPAMRTVRLNWLLVPFCVCISYACSVNAQTTSASIVGEHAGTLGELHLRLHIPQDPTGTLTWAIDSIDQDAIGIPCCQLALSGTQFSFTVPAVPGTYKGEFSSDGNTVTGTWTQGDQYPLVSTQRIQQTAVSLNPQLAEIDSMASAAYVENPVGSMTVGVVSGKGLIWTKSYGDSDMEKHVPADRDTAYRIGSITKMFTAVMLEQLVDAGKVHLSDPVEKYFPEVNTGRADIPMLRRLLLSSSRRTHQDWAANRTIPTNMCRVRSQTGRRR
jgi:hypothetical protein